MSRICNETGLSCYCVGLCLLRGQDPQITWICTVCAEKLGASMSEQHCATWHEDTCPVCGKTATVTEPRDFSWPSGRPTLAEARRRVREVEG